MICKKPDIDSFAEEQIPQQFLIFAIFNDRNQCQLA